MSRSVIHRRSTRPKVPLSNDATTDDASFLPRSERRLFLLLYLLSGTAALMYQVIWSRLLTLEMGQTVGAVGTVLAAFMGGLAGGAALAGRAAGSMPSARALRTYALLETAIAISALALPLALSGLHPVLGWAYRNGDGTSVFGVTRVVLSLLLVSAPAAAMGATYPIGVRCFAGTGRAAPARASGLYAANTAGAAIGAALAGFLMLPALGLSGATIVGVGLNALAAAGAFFLAGRAQQMRHGEAEAPRDVSRTAGVAPSRARSRQADESRLRAVVWPRLAAVAVGISGAVALINEVAWTRILSLVLGPTTYALSAMLVAVITGLAIGSSLGAALLARLRRPGVWLGVAILLAAAAALLACWQIDRFPLAIAEVVAPSEVTFGSVLAAQTLLAIAFLLPMAIALGAVFPLAIAVATGGGHDTPAEVALVYATNTAGAIGGALAASFLLIPAFGLQTTVRAAGGFALVTGAAIWWLFSGGRLGRVAALVTAIAGLAAAAFMPQWNRELLSSGAYRYAPAVAAAGFESGLEAGHLLYYREGATGTISVKRLGGVTSLAIDGKVDASTGSDMLTQKLLAHLPLLLHPDPRRVCVIGLGSGVTLGAALRHGIERADVLEISPEVVAASEHFTSENHEALRDPRTRLIVGDGRSHLLLAHERYDVIISEPSNPWLAGVAPLFTREFFLGVHQRLRPGGILCQWAHTYNISDEDLRSIVATFLAVFPEGTAWLVGDGDLLLIGSATRLESLDRGVSDAWQRPGVAADLSQVAVHDPFSLLTLFVGAGADLRRYASDAPVQSDDRLSLEYSAPRAVYGHFQASNVGRIRDLAVRAVRPPAVANALAGATAAAWRNRGLMQLQAAAHGIAYEDFRRAAAQAPRDDAALDGLARAAAAAGRTEDASKFLRDLATASHSAPALIRLSRLLASQGRMEEAEKVAREALSLEPGTLAPLEQLASVYADERDHEALEPVVAALKAADPDRPATLLASATLHYLRDELTDAGRVAERLVSLDPGNTGALNLLGGVYQLLGDGGRARRALEAAARTNPRDPATLLNLARFELKSGNAAAAADRFAEALILYPKLTSAAMGLADALEQQGETVRAAKLRGRFASP